MYFSVLATHLWFPVHFWCADFWCSVISRCISCPSSSNSSILSLEFFHYITNISFVTYSFPAWAEWCTVTLFTISLVTGTSFFIIIDTFFAFCVRALTSVYIVSFSLFLSVYFYIQLLHMAHTLYLWQTTSTEIKFSLSIEVVILEKNYSWR